MKIRQVARQVIEDFVGTQGAHSVFFYTGEPDQDGFEEKLRGVFGTGSALVLEEISRRLGKRR